MVFSIICICVDIEHRKILIEKPERIVLAVEAVERRKPLYRNFKSQLFKKE